VIDDQDAIRVEEAIKDGFKSFVTSLRIGLCEQRTQIALDQV